MRGLNALSMHGESAMQAQLPHNTLDLASTSAADAVWGSRDLGVSLAGSALASGLRVGAQFIAGPASGLASQSQDIRALHREIARKITHPAVDVAANFAAKALLEGHINLRDVGSILTATLLNHLSNNTAFHHRFMQIYNQLPALRDMVGPILQNMRGNARRDPAGPQAMEAGYVWPDPVPIPAAYSASARATDQFGGEDQRRGMTIDSAQVRAPEHAYDPELSPVASRNFFGD